MIDSFQHIMCLTCLHNKQRSLENRCTREILGIPIKLSQVAISGECGGRLNIGWHWYQLSEKVLSENPHCGLDRVCPSSWKFSTFISSRLDEINFWIIFTQWKLFNRNYQTELFITTTSVLFKNIGSRTSGVYHSYEIIRVF